MNSATSRSDPIPSRSARRAGSPWRRSAAPCRICACGALAANSSISRPPSESSNPSPAIRSVASGSREPPAAEGSLAVVAAQSSRELALSIERRGADGQWRVVGFEHGLAPVAAWPATAGDNGAWRAVVWTVGGGDAPITLAARALTKRGRSLGDVTLEPAPIEGVAEKLCAALVAVPSATLVELGAPQSTLSAGSTPGRLLIPAQAGPLAPQSERLWLVSRGDCGQTLRVAPFAWRGGEVGLALGEGERATLPVPSAPSLPFFSAPSGKARVWRARSAFGQPALDAGRGFGAAPGAALALAGKDAPQAWNASGSEPLRLTVQAIDVDVTAHAGGASTAQQGRRLTSSRAKRAIVSSSPEAMRHSLARAAQSRAARRCRSTGVAT